jgi:MscS family membrane protein
MASNSTSIIGSISNSTYIRGIESGVSSATGLSQAWADLIVAAAIVIPNADISKSNIINYSLPDSKVRFEVKVGIAYDSDVEKASGILLDIAGHTDGVLKDPAPKVYIKDLGNFSINMLMHVWVTDYRLSWEVPDSIYRETLKRFKAENIEIPYPVTSVILNKPRTGIIVEALNLPIKR